MDVVQQVWDWVELSTPQPVERILIPRLYELKELVLPLVRPRLEVSELRGQGKGSPLQVTYVGLDYGKPYLTKVMFAEEPEEIAQKPISVWHPTQVAYAPGSDILIVTGSERLIRKLPCQNALILPRYVDHILDIRGDWEQVEMRLRSSRSIRSEFSSLQRYNYSFEISQDARDFEMHYHSMYLPTMETRHGDAAAIVSQREARQLFRRGCLFLVKREGQTVAGCLCHIQRHKVRFIYLGVAHGDKQLVEEGVIGAMNILRLRWANEVGYQAVDLLGCPPYFRMGVFQYKRKWGTTVSLPPKSHKLIWIRFQHDTPAVRQFIKDNPCIIIGENGDLQGLVVVDDVSSITSEAHEQLHKQYCVPGLKGLLIRSVTDLVGQSDGRLALSTKDLLRPQQEERSL